MSYNNEKIINCKNCGAPLVDYKCEYCGAEYAPSYEMICIESPKVERLRAEVRVPRYDQYRFGDDLSKYTIERLTHELAKGLAAFMKIQAEQDYRLDATIIRGEVRVVPPDFRF